MYYTINLSTKLPFGSIIRLNMTTKEKIILVTLELAAKHGLKSLSMSQIAEGVGIKKPSLYNHFASKEQLIKGVYEYLRDKSKQSLKETSYARDTGNRSAYNILLEAVLNYKKMVSNGDMLRFYKVIYAERATDRDAAEIVVKETEKMIDATKVLFETLNKENKLNITEIDIAATSFAITIHGLIDHGMDIKAVGRSCDDDEIEKYIKWFCDSYKKEEK